MHALFDRASDYSRIRAGFTETAKLQGYFRWLALPPRVRAPAGSPPATASEPVLAMAASTTGPPARPALALLSSRPGARLEVRAEVVIEKQKPGEFYLRAEIEGPELAGALPADFLAVLVCPQE